jgi:hypothetical protein
MYDPLPHVAAQVQKNVLDAVVRLVLPPAQVPVVKLIETIDDLLHRACQRLPRFGQERGADR